MNLKSENEYLEIMRQAFTGPQDELTILIKPIEAFMTVSLLQFADRGLSQAGRDETDFMRKFAKHIGQHLQAAVATVTNEQVAEIMETGWNPRYDVGLDGEFIDPALRHLQQNESGPADVIARQLANHAATQPPRTIIEVHNVWTIYGVNADGTEADTKLAAAGQRPQDWGHPRWKYHEFRFDWISGDKHWINHFHGWTDLDRPEHEYPSLFAPLMVTIMQPGQKPQLCGRTHLSLDDFWLDEWGEWPPIYDDHEAENDYGHCVDWDTEDDDEP